jgi:hypothetical protein
MIKYVNHILKLFIKIPYNGFLSKVYTKLLT